MDVEISEHAIMRYAERVKKIPRCQLSSDREQAIREEIKNIIRDCAKRPSRGDETTVLIVDHLNYKKPGQAIVVTVLSGFKRIKFGSMLRWHHRVVAVDDATVARLSA